MISEKTVELNVTAELLGWLYWVTKRTHIALAPSQRAEGRLGYDVSYHGGGWPVCLLQYKRAYVYPTGIWEWRLNRTRRRDQHSRLTHLEVNGFPVLYALPFFHTPQDLRAKRRRLLVHMFWYPPSFITPSSPVDEHHDVRYDPPTGRWWVESPDQVEIRPPLGAGAVIEGENLTRSREISLERFTRAVNAVFAQDEDDAVTPIEPSGDAEGNALDGQSLVVSYAER